MTSMDLSKGATPATVTSQKTEKNILFHYAKQKIKDNLKISIVATILHFVAVPLILISIISNIAMYNKEDPNEFIALIGGISTVCAGLIGIVCALSTFNYLYKKSNVDMIHSLPMSTNGRFITDFVTGFLSYIVPFIVNQVLSLILFGIGFLAFDGKPIIYNSYDKTFSECTIFSEAFPYYIKLALGGLLVMLFFYTVTVFVATCCGTVFESVVYTILFNGIIPATIAVVMLVLFNDVYGVNVESSAFKIISWTSPVGSALGLVDCITQGEISNTENPSLIAWFIAIIIAITVFIGLTFYLYKKRKAENVGKPFVFKIFYYMIISCITFCIGCIFLYEIRENTDASDRYMPFVIITAITYLIFEVVTNRGFKKFWLSIIRYAATLACVAGIYFLVVNTGGFGAETRIPVAANVSKVTISYHGYFNVNNSRYNYRSGSNQNTELTLKDKENIQTIIDAHTSRIDNFKKYGEGFIYEDRISSLPAEIGYEKAYSGKSYSQQSYYGDFEVTYTLKSGGIIKRSYDRISYDEVEILKNLDFTEEFRSQYIDKQISEIKNAFKQMNDDKNRSSDAPTITIFGTISNYNGTTIKLSTLPDSFSEQLCNAVRADMEAETADMYFTPEKPSVCNLNLNYYRFDISANYTNTLNLLSNYSDLNFEVSKKEAMEYVMQNNVYLFSYDDFKEITGSGTINTNMNFRYDDHCVSNYTDDLKTLINVAKTQYITDEKCYTIIVNNKLAVIPPEYNGIAERVYENIGNPYDNELEYKYYD